jgi:hypothetical protein
VLYHVSSLVPTETCSNSTGRVLLTTCQPSTVWCSRERLPAAAAQLAQGSSEPVAPRIYLLFLSHLGRR